MKKKSRILTNSVIILILTMAMVLGAVTPSFVSAQTDFIWLARDGKAQVVTGLGNGTGTEGIWFIASDNPDGGKSKVIWDHADPNDNGSTVSDADIRKFGGVSGTAVLDDNGALDYKPYVDICFNIVGMKDSKPEVGDASDWGGISISYECDVAPHMQLSLGDDVDKEMYYGYPEYSLPKAVAGEGVVKTIAWDQFKQPGWIGSTALKVTGEEAAKMLVNVRFKIQGSPGEYHFRIAGVGSASVTLPKPADPSITGHWLTPVPAKAATCLEGGNIAYYTCSDCGKLFKDSEGIFEVTAAEVKVAATGHNWNEWVVVKAATETSTGTRIRTCKNDSSHIESEEIPKLGSMPGWQAISDDGKKLTDADGQEYIVTDKGDLDKLKKDDQVADEKTGGKYKVESVTSTNGKVTGGTVVFQSLYYPTAKTVVVKDTVTINGVKFKITEISAKACKGNKNINKITIGKNVKKIGAGAFDGCSNLKNITIKTTKLTAKTVGKNAFRGLHKKAKAKVPAKKLKSYKSILKSKGMKGKKQKITK